VRQQREVTIRQVLRSKRVSVALLCCGWYEGFGTAAEDKAQARDAEARAAQRYNLGRLSAKDEGEVDRKTNVVLARTGE
jgi:hypothetical protein